MSWRGLNVVREGVTLMADADCGICRSLGYRSCDVCGNPTFPNEVFGIPAGDLCEHCK